MSTQSKTPLFLMEAVIMLLVFAISASVCLKVFVGAKTISQESYNIDKACMEAQRAAEYWQSTKGNISETADFLNAKVSGDTLEIFYDEDWMCTTEASVFTLTMKTSDATADIVISEHGKELFSIKSEAVIFGE